MRHQLSWQAAEAVWAVVQIRVLRHLLLRREGEPAKVAVVVVFLRLNGLKACLGRISGRYGNGIAWKQVGTSTYLVSNS